MGGEEVFPLLPSGGGCRLRTGLRCSLLREQGTVKPSLKELPPRSERSEEMFSAWGGRIARATVCRRLVV